jgi:hypothetical protein
MRLQILYKQLWVRRKIFGDLFYNPVFRRTLQKNMIGFAQFPRLENKYVFFLTPKKMYTVFICRAIGQKQYREYPVPVYSTAPVQYK